MSSSVSSSHRRWGTILMVGIVAVGCDIEPSEYEFGFNITGQRFTLYNDDVGIHPHQDVLLDPNNMFREYGVGSETKWAILANAGNVATFYAWATLLANQPNGEHQFFTGVALEGIYLVQEAPEEDLPVIREMAIRAYQSVLDNFPESVTYDSSGERSFRLATFAFNRIIGLGGRVVGDWVLVQTPSGGTEAVRSASIDPPRAEEEGT